MGEAPPRVEEKPEWWASPSVLGLMGFGLTTMMAGLSNLPSPYGNGFAGNWAVYGLAIAFGGIAQLIAGIIGLRKGNLFAGTAFVGYGAFWLSFTAITSAIPTTLGTVPTGALYAISAFAFLWMMFTLTFLINSMKHGWGIFFVFLFLFISFILLVVKFWQLAAGNTVSTGESWAVGGIIILTGLTAWYVATADLTNWNYGRKVLPV
jgi:uncharacterized protein